MNNETVTFEYQETNVRPVFGGKKIEAVYVMTHLKNSRKNQYRVVCEVAGIQNRNVELYCNEAKFIGDLETQSNDETLTEEAAKDLFDEWS